MRLMKNAVLILTNSHVTRDPCFYDTFWKSSMKSCMKSATLYRYALPMDSGVILRHTRLIVRDGFLVECRDGDKRGWGEIAPLPEYSEETPEQAKAQTQTVLALWLAGEPIDWNALYPSVAFGLSVALAQLNGALPAEGNYATAPLCTGDPDEVLDKLADLPGQKIAKVKIGMYEAIGDAIVVNTLLEALPSLTLRLDANRQWSPKKAAQFAQYVSPAHRKRIAFIEEPCQLAEQTLTFSQETGILVAWDETLRDPGFKLEAKEGLKAIVIKPSLIGSLDKIQMLVEKAHQLGMEAVISSSLESSFGLVLLARIAQWLTPDTLPGLDTVSLFKTQLITPWPQCTLPLMPLSECELVWQECKE